MRKSAPILIAMTVALVCALPPRPAESHLGVTTTITFDREISRILTKKCISCHSDGSLAFPLTTYEETRPWARAIQEDLLSRRMPPWRAVPGYGRFTNDGGLTTRELQMFVAWIEGNGPKTAGQKNIPPIANSSTPEHQRLVPDFERSNLGQPSFVRRVNADGAAAAILADSVTRTIVDLELTSARHIRALEFRPADRQNLRAAHFWLESTGQWLASWTPWHDGMILPRDIAYLVPAGSRVVADLHHGDAGNHDTPTAGYQRPLGEVAFYEAERRSLHCPADILLRADGHMAPHATNERFYAATALAADTAVLSLFPELHDGARSLEVRARKPDGTVEVLLLIRDILHDWPTPYILDAPLMLPRATELSAIAYYDNPTNSRRPGGVLLRATAYGDSPCTANRL